MNIKQNIFEKVKFGYLGNFTNFVFNNERFVKIPRVQTTLCEPINAYSLDKHLYRHVDDNVDIILGSFKQARLFDLEIGDTFIYETKIYMLLRERPVVNAFCFNDNNLTYITYDEEVIPVELDLSITAR